MIFLRRINLRNYFLILLVSLLPSCKTRNTGRSDDELRKMALEICRNNIILDSHIDWPEFILDNPEDISGLTIKGDFDLVRAEQGGLNAVLSVVYIDADYNVENGRKMVDSLLKIIRHYPETYPDKFALAFTPEDVRRNFGRKLFSLIPCLENGSPVGDDIGYLEYLKDQGIAYMTLCHVLRNQISDSNYDDERKWNGLSPGGKEIIKEMNRLGIMIDISHSTDSAVVQALRYSDAPVIASHSSCRYFTPGLERNLPDNLIKAIAKKKGIIMVNFGSLFLDSVCMINTDKILSTLNIKGISYESKEGIELISEYGRTHRLLSDSKQLVDHIEHIIEVAGIDYVGLGSDFDGIGPSKPSDIPDVSGYPVIVFELLRRGYSETDIKKILSGNFLRVWEEVIKIADEEKSDSGSRGFIGVSADNPSYLQYSNGQPFIPVGINMISPGGKYGDNADSSFHEMERWMKNLSDNGGNYIRVWLSQSFWDIEDKQAGVYSEEKAERIDRLIEMARKYNLKIKMTLEHFRSLTMEENPQMWATKPVYHTSNGGPLDSIRQYLTSSEGHRLFLDKVDFYSKRYGSDTLFSGWELWNEMNAMKGPQDSTFLDWNKNMLREVKHRFPENLVMQSLGSFDDDRVRPLYKNLMLMQGNEVAQVHRYLDPGAKMEVCKMPMDIICSSAVEELLSYNTGKPVMLAETGAVESRHSGPSRFYQADTAGILLHDILFAPFFSGSAGTGMCWHWDSYVAKNNLWHHYNSFSEAVRGVNPITEKFTQLRYEEGVVKIYTLKGSNTILLWLRDRRNTWESELRDLQAPSLIEGFRLDLKNLEIRKSFRKISVYDPWKDKWEKVRPEGRKILLPDFKRSLVVRIEKTD